MYPVIKSVSSSNQPSACLYTVVDDDYDHAVLKEWGNSAEYARRMNPGTVYIDGLLDKVVSLYSIQPDPELPLSDPMHRFHKRAVIDHLNKVHSFINSFINDKYRKSCDGSKNRYVMTHPSHWEPGKVAYLKSLAIQGGIVSETDHQQRLIMYGETEAILRFVQEQGKDSKKNENLKQGHGYLVCDLGGSKVKMQHYTIIEPINGVLGERRMKWGAGESEFVQGGNNIVQNLEQLALKKLFPNHEFEMGYFEDKFIDRRKEFAKLTVEPTFQKMLVGFTGESIETRYIPIPFRLQVKSFRADELQRKFSFPRLFDSQKDRASDKLAIQTQELIDDVYRPVAEKIMSYLKRVIDIYFHKVKAMILVGGFRHSPFLLNFIKMACEEKKLALIMPTKDGGDQERFKSFEVVCGAIFKSMDTSAAQDPVPKIEYVQDMEKEFANVIVHIGKFFLFIFF